jgi:hypothetical protein
MVKYSKKDTMIHGLPSLSKLMSCYILNSSLNGKKELIYLYSILGYLDITKFFEPNDTVALASFLMVKQKEG